MDMDVLFEPPMLYLFLVMIGWSIGCVPRLAGRQEHRLVFFVALLHLVIYSVLIHHSVNHEPLFSILFASLTIVVALTVGGYVLFLLEKAASVEFNSLELAKKLSRICASCSFFKSAERNSV
jgi:hypothetical protein